MHEVPSHTHAADAQWRPFPQLPVTQIPPQPSAPPQAFPVQLGVQPQTPGGPPPPQVSGLPHALPGQHGWPFPPQAPQLALPQATPLAHAAHTVPPAPHAVSLVPGWQADTSQQPVHEAPSQTHNPVTHRWPLPHAPLSQTPPHPSPAPHALPAQVGVHPHTPGRPPPPHWSGLAHAPAQHG